MAQDKIQRTFYVDAKAWALFQKQSIDLNTSSSQRIEEYIIGEVKYGKKGGLRKK